MGAACGAAMPLTISFPEYYELLFIPLAMSWVMNLFLTIQVSIARKRYDVQYPNLYAPANHPKPEAAYKFNCVQRAHQNTLESWSMVMVTMFATGLVYPVPAAAAGTTWVLGRFVYGFGYALGNPAFRMPGGMLSHVGDLPLMGMAFRIAYNALLDKYNIAVLKGFVENNIVALKGLAKTHAGLEL